MFERSIRTIYRMTGYKKFEENFTAFDDSDFEKNRKRDHVITWFKTCLSTCYNMCLVHVLKHVLNMVLNMVLFLTSLGRISIKVLRRV